MLAQPGQASSLSLFVEPSCDLAKVPGKGMDIHGDAALLIYV